MTTVFLTVPNRKVTKPFLGQLFYQKRRNASKINY